MKKILGLTVAALLVMGLIGGGTWAYFTDVETSTGNTFAAGTLDLEVDTENPWTSTAIDNSATPMKPGETFTPVGIACKNVGTLPGDLYMQITAVLGVGGATTYPSGTPVCSSEPEYEAEGGPSTWVAIDTIDTEVTLSCENATVGITGLDGVKLDVAGAAGWKLVEASVAANATVTVDLGATLDTTATNEYQGDTVSFTIEFQLVQEGESAS
ncbi:hypothetical protein ES703_57704 [subsurface metagenome]